MSAKHQILATRSSLHRAASILRVLSHPARLQILQFIRENEQTVTAIQKHAQLTQAMTSQHLKIMFESGLIQKRRQGTSIFYVATKDIGVTILNTVEGCKELWYDK